MPYLIFLLTIFYSLWGLKLEDKGDTYIWKGETEGPVGCYRVSEIQLMPDSTYIRKDYSCGYSKDIKNYKKWDVETSHGTIRKSNKGFIMTEYRDGHMTDFNWYIKIKRNHIRFFSKNYINPRKWNKGKGIKFKKASL